MKNTTDFEDILIGKYGKKGTEKRDRYDADSLAFRLGAMLKEARKEAKLRRRDLPSVPARKKAIYPASNVDLAISKSRPITN